MTSKISFFKLLREDIRRRSWLLALISLYMFVALPVLSLMELNNWIDRMNRNNENLTVGVELIKWETIQKWFGEYISFNGFIVAGIVICAVFCAATGFLYLHSKIKLDLFHSIPVRREKMFLVQFVSGIILFAVPYFICLLLCILIGAVKGVLTVQIVGNVFGAFAVFLLYFLLFYLTAIAAMLLTGKLVVGILGTAVFYAYSPVVMVIMQEMASTFFDTYADIISVRSSVIGTYLSPAGLYIDVMTDVMNGKGIPWTPLLCSAVFVLILLAVCIWIYRIRPTEAAEKSMAFKKSEPVIKVLLVVPCAILAGLFFRSFSRTGSDGWFFFGILFCAVIGNGMIEFIYHMDLREIFKKKISFGIAIAAAMMAALIYRFDLLGYDSYVPKDSSIQSMSIYASNLNANFGRFPGIPGGVEDSLKKSQTEDFPALYEVVKKAALDSVTREQFYRIYAGEEDTEVYTSIYVMYQLKNKSPVYRKYFVSEQALEEELRTVWDETDFRTRINPIKVIDVKEVERISMQSIKGPIKMPELSQEQIEKLFSYYQDDMYQISYDEIQTIHPIAEFSIELHSFSYDMDHTDYLSDFNIYPSFQNTLKYLAEIGCPLSDKISAEEVAKISVWDERAEAQQTEPENGETAAESTTENGDYTFTNVEDMQEILDALDVGVYNYVYRGSTHDNGMMNATIYWKDGTVEPVSYQVKEDMIPECIKKAIEEQQS